MIVAESDAVTSDVEAGFLKMAIVLISRLLSSCLLTLIMLPITLLQMNSLTSLSEVNVILSPHA